MSLLRYWPVADEINDCIKEQAEGAHDAVLLAVHRPFPLAYKLVSSGENFPASEDELFKYLITPDVPSGAHVVPITGGSGVGKSHMVRILNARLQSVNEDGRYVVIRIPKSASLRRVVELILEKLPENEYAQVRAEFGKALSENLDVETAAIRFQAELGIALGQLAKELETKVKGNPGDAALKEQLGHARHLPKFMGDSALVEHFQRTVFPRFVKRAIAGQIQIENEDSIKDFVSDDLVLPESIDISKSASTTNAYYIRTLLGREGEGLRAATRLLNDNMIVDQAIRQSFNLNQALGGMTLQDVILEIRRRLLSQRRELVVFVEDFKALTGIQDILLKVLIQEGVRDGVQELATMRSVIAVTDGYLDTEDTIATRAKREWKVESELTHPQEVLNRTKALVAAYLNAARWGFRDLVRHFETKGEGGNRNRWIGVYVDPDGNEDSPALAAFGYEEDIPLFPYTEQAIEHLAKAALTRNNSLVFTPRFIIDNVLHSLLREGRPAFEQGQFPPPLIYAPPATAEVAQWLASLPVSAELRERYRRVVSIWGNSPKTPADVGNIPPEVFSAFKLEPPAVEFRPPPKKVVNPGPDQTGDVTPPPRKPENDLLKETLEKWIQGESMPQNVANQIRKSVAAAINNRIDWSAERCTKVLIKPTQISIPNARGEGNLAPNPIKVSEDHTDESGHLRSELAAVTQLYDPDNGNDSYENSDEDLVWVANLVDRLMPKAMYLVRAGTLKKLAEAARLLRTNSLLLGLTTRGKTPASLAPFLFGEATNPPELPVGSNAAFVEWRALQKQALQVRPELIQLVESLSGSFQGRTGTTAYAIDMVRVADALEVDPDTQRETAVELPTELRAVLDSMSEIKAKSKAGKAFREAASIRDRLIAEFGESFNKQEIVDEFKALADQFGNLGTWPQDIGIAPVAFKNRCDDFREAAVGRSLDILAKAADENTAEKGDVHLLSRTGLLDFNPLIVADELSNLARKVVRAAEREAVSLEAKSKGVDPQAEAGEIQSILRSLQHELESFSAEGETL
jgi:hypothetical protein